MGRLSVRSSGFAACPHAVLPSRTNKKPGKNEGVRFFSGFGFCENGRR
jgi:hypothetical protein